MWIPFLDFLLLTAIFSPISFPLCFLPLGADNVSSSILLYIAKPWGTALSRLPSTVFLRLRGYYSAIRLPANRLLSCLFRLYSIPHIYTLYVGLTGSPQLTCYPCTTWHGSLTPPGFMYSRHIEYPHVAFRQVHSVSPRYNSHFGAQ